MSKTQQLMQSVSKRMNLPLEILSNEPMIEVKGRQEATIIHHRGIVEYTTERIQVGCRGGLICLTGAGMNIALMNSERIVICGRIDAVEFTEGSV